MLMDARKNQDILDYLQECAPNFMPGLDSALKNGQGYALSRIFAEMAELVVNRLNKAPDKNLLAFLDVLGVKMLPSQPAIVPVSFALSTGAPGGVFIPKGTVVTAGKVQFQTDSAIWAVRQSIVAAFAYLPGDDRIFACPDGVIKGQAIVKLGCALTADASQGKTLLCVDSSDGFAKADQIALGRDSPWEYATIDDVKDKSITLARPLQSTHNTGEQVIRGDKASRTDGFSLIAGENVQEHCLYIGHADLFNLKSAVTIQLQGEGIADLADIECTWEFWGEDNKANVDWHSLDFEPDGESINLIKTDSGEIKKLKINGVESRWIRCRTERADLLSSPIGILIGNKADSMPSGLDSAFYNDVPVDITQNTILPFGSRPCQGDAFYIASQEVFSKPNSSVTLTITNKLLSLGDSSTGQDSAYQKARKGLRLSWEYWNGKGWIGIPNPSTPDNRIVDNLNLIDEFLPEKAPSVSTIDVSFTCPSDFANVAVAGQLNKWLRIRIAGGDYGREIMFVSGVWNPLTIIVPQVSIALTYRQSSNSIPPEKCLTVNNLTQRDFSGQMQARQPIIPFEKLDPGQDSPALYFGFDGKPENGPVSLYFSMSDDLPLSESMDCPVRWYCYTESSGWSLLDTVDNTHNLTRSGAIEFLFPSDFSSLLLFGRELFWIKAAIEGKAPSDLPSIKAIYLNTVASTQAQTVTDEILGSSDASPDQIFTLINSPVIDCQLWVDEINSISEDGKNVLLSEGLVIRDVPGQYGMSEQCWVQWIEVDDFLDSQNEDRLFVLDKSAGRITFGNGTNGKIPPPGIKNIKATYRIGGGKTGNVAAHAISTLQTSVQFVNKVFNPLAAERGADAETMDSVIQRGPYIISHRNYAVTPRDFERLASQASPFVKRTKCYTTGTAIVNIIVVPDGSDDRPTPSLELRETIEQNLADCCLNTVFPANINVIGPDYVPIDSAITVVPVSMDQAVPVSGAIQTALKEFFHPLTGGVDGTGWDFERHVVHISDVYAIVGKISGVDHIKNLTLMNISENTDYDIQSFFTTSPVPPYPLVCSGVHLVTVTMKG